MSIDLMEQVSPELPVRCSEHVYICVCVRPRWVHALCSAKVSGVLLVSIMVKYACSDQCEQLCRDFIRPAVLKSAGVMIQPIKYTKQVAAMQGAAAPSGKRTGPAKGKGGNFKRARK